MDVTDCLALPYPECDPPEVKDASDIVQMKNLALAVDSAVQQLDDVITEYLTEPDSVLMEGGAAVAGRIQDIPFTSFEFDNASMASIPDARIKIQSTGWYLIGGWVRGTHGVDAGIGIRVQPTVNGDPVSNRQGPGRPTFAGASATDDLSLNAVSLFLNAGDLVGMRTNHTGAVGLSVAYSATLWATRILINV